MKKLLRSIRKIVLPVLILTVTNMNSVMADKLCFYSPSQAEGELGDANCPTIDSTTGLYLSWVSDIDSFNGVPTEIRLDGNYKANSFLPTTKLLSYETSPERKPKNSQSNRPAARVRSLIPAKNDILGHLKWELYSIEDRVELKQENNIISLSCHPGKAPAGVVFRLPYSSFPTTENYSVVIRGLADQRFKIGFADNNNSLLKNAQNFPARLSAEDHKREGYDSVRLSGFRDVGSKIIVECPQQAAHLDIAEMVVSHDNANHSLATWIWHKQDWLISPNKLLDWAEHYGMKKLYIQVEIKNNHIVDEEQLVHLITKARKRKIDIYAAEGDAQMIRGKGQDFAFQRSQCLAAFQKRLPAQSKLAGIQYDIEPYADEKFANDPAQMWRDWAATLIKMHDIWGGPIDIVIPYWMQNSPDGKDALFSVKQLGSFTVMAYRTRETELYDISTQWLVWGEKSNTKVSLAFENGPVNGATKMFFKPASRLSIHNFSRPYVMLVTNTENQIKKTIYELVYIDQPNSNNISFLSRTDNLKSIIVKLEPYLSAFSSFNGVIIHWFN